MALSFDAGSDAGFAGQILDTLAANGIHASFGMTGTWAEKNPDVFRRIVRDGHHLINHTYDHTSWTGLSTSTPPLSEAERLRELSRAEEVFTSLAGASGMPYYRPPYGDVDAATDALLGRAGYQYDVLWTVDSRGWKGDSAEQIVVNVRPGEIPGGILLFHVGAASQDADALQRVIDEIRAAGLRPGSVAEVV